MEKIAVFPGSFDPFTIGHESVVNRALSLFDKIYIAVGSNINKKSFFPLEKKIEWIRKVFEGNEKVIVEDFSGLTVDFCHRVGAGYLLRGLRTSADFEYERAVGQTNKALDQGIETIFLLTKPEHTFINSTIVRDIIRHGGDANKFIPDSINLRDYQPE
jgi:pantetheine-phosphate adenylyltransferase